MSFSAMTQVDAVNLMLRAIGQSAVTDITTTSNVDVVNAVAVLARVCRDVQLVQYSFNVDVVTLTPDPVTGYCAIPTTSVGLAREFTDFTYSLISLPYHHEYQLTQGTLLSLPTDFPMPTVFPTTSTVQVPLIVPRDFESLPNHARQYIAACAVVDYVADSTGDEGKIQVAAKKQLAASSQFRKNENRTNRPNLLRR